MDISIPEPEDLEVEDEEEEGFTQDDIDSFKDTWEQFGNKILKEMEIGGNNKELKKSIKSVTKTMKKSMNSKTNTLIKQLIWFGKDQHKKRLKGKLRSAINVQPTAVARSRANGTKRRGRKAVKRGRPYKDVGKEVIVDGEVIPAQPAPMKRKKRSKHSFKDSLAKNKPPSRRHDRQ